MAVLSSIVLSDFKKFTHFTVSCRETNILVGPNNAGKSSILDALRLLADVLRVSRRDQPTLREQPGHGVCATYTLPLRAIGIPTGNLVRNYGQEFARIEFRISNGNSLYVHVHPEHGAFAFVKMKQSTLARTSSAFRSAIDLDVVVVPTLSALEAEENYVTDETVKRNENTRLASRSFRNIVYRQSDSEFEEFHALCKIGWQDVEVQKPEVVRGFPAQVIMMFSEDRIEREVYWSGFGFQVWLQMMLQFLRAKEGSLLVLDEPDIYLHPDLQRRLLQVARRKFSQIVVATHSTEIVNDADPGDVLLVDSDSRSARRISSDDGYRRVYAYLGSSENAEFARIARAKRIVFFEGKERGLVRKFARKAGTGDLLDDPYTIYLQAGGYSQRRRIKETDWALHEIFGVDAKIGALFDRDYRCEEDIDEFQSALQNADFWVGVLNRKEIENYALVESALIRAIERRLVAKEMAVGPQDLTELIVGCADTFRDTCRAQMAAMYLSFHGTRRKDIDAASHLEAAMHRFDQGWATVDGRLAMLPGKEFIATLSTLMQKRFGFSVTTYQIVDEMFPAEVDPELTGKLVAMSRFFEGTSRAV